MKMDNRKMGRLILWVVCLFGFGISLTAQPVIVQPKSKANKYSDARSVFTRFKDLRFSNYAAYDALKNMELQGDVFSGFSMSAGSPRFLFGINYGAGFLLDYYFKEGFAIRTGLQLRGSNLFRNVSLFVVDNRGDTIGNGLQQYQVNMGQLIIPIHLLFTQYHRNKGLWLSFGMDFALNLQGSYNIQNTTNIADPTIRLSPPSDKKQFFDKNNARQTYFNRLTLYADFTVGYKVNKFMNFYGKIQISALPLQNAYMHSLTHSSANFGMLFSLWQY